ncbi:MAG: hypothetical protein V1755_10125 [Chloroflexota bacterium]
MNIGTKRAQPNGQENETAGINKTSTTGRVQISAIGIAQDFIGDQPRLIRPSRGLRLHSALHHSRRRHWRP